MTKVQVDRAIRKYSSPKRLTVAIVSENVKTLRAELASGKPTPMSYDTKDTPAEVLERDKAIEGFPLRFSAAGSRSFRGSRVREVEWPVDAWTWPLPYLAQDR